MLLVDVFNNGKLSSETRSQIHKQT